MTMSEDYRHCRACGAFCDGDVCSSACGNDLDARVREHIERTCGGCEAFEDGPEALPACEECGEYLCGACATLPECPCCVRDNAGTEDGRASWAVLCALAAAFVWGLLIGHLGRLP